LLCILENYHNKSFCNICTYQ